jgi:hypothetical protein
LINVLCSSLETLGVLDVLGTFVPNDEIFGKAYMPHVKGSRLDQIKVIDVSTWFLEGLP